jgi:hypothetical protein
LLGGFSSDERFRKLYNPAAVSFAARIGLYTPCDVQYGDDDKVTGAPIRLLWGIADDYIAIAAWKRNVPASGCVFFTRQPDPLGAKLTIGVTAERPGGGAAFSKLCPDAGATADYGRC